MASTEYRWEEFTPGRIVTWIFFVALAVAVAVVSSLYGRERFAGREPSNSSLNSSYETKPTMAVVKIKKGFPFRSSPRSKPDDNQIMLLPEGETLTVVGSLEGPWYNVRRSDGTEGWIHGNGIDLY